MSINPEASPTTGWLYMEQTPGLAEPSYFREVVALGVRLIGRTALIFSVATAPGVVLGVGEAISTPRAAYAATEFPNDYPDQDAAPYNVANYDWWKDEDGNLTYSGSNELLSSRLYAYRNCTDGVAYWVKKYTDVTVPTNLGDAKNWDDNAPTAYDVYDGNTNSIEPGDIAQSDDGKYGHIGFVTSVTKDASGAVTSFTTAEMNKSGDGNYTANTYNTRNSSNKFSRGGTNDWDHFIDVNGTGKGLNNETWPGTTTPTDTDHDGINDPQDQCPGVPGIQALQGCPPGDIDRDGIADLVVVNTQNTGSGMTEAHELTGGSGYNTWFGHQATAVGYLTPTQETLMGDVNADYRPDLVVINTVNTGSGKVEVHAMDGANGFSSWIEHAVTPLDYTNATQKYALADLNDDNRADLLIINTENTGSGKVEVHALDAATHYSTWLGHWVTPADYFNLSNQQVLVGDANGDKRPDILIVNTANTGSGKVEVHELNGANGFSTWQGHWTTPLGNLTAGQRLAMGDANADKIADLFVINTDGTQNGSGKVEVHPLSGATHYSTWLGHYVATPLASLDSAQRVVMGG